jgi:hypothetical protein
MRHLITLVEDAQGLNPFSVQAVMHSLANPPRDVESSSLVQSFDLAGNDPRFADELEISIGIAKSELTDWLIAPTPLMRGLRHAPKPGQALGIHWTDKQITAQDYGNGAFLLRADVRPDQIDWHGTILRRLVWPKEREFTLIPGSELKGTVEHKNQIIGAFSGRA